jgi:DNA (cytosine-5)-methyltransferase 1
MMDQPKVVSIYSGVGGLDWGFDRAGFNVVYATDIWDVACSSLKENFPETEISCNNIENVDFQNIRNKYKNIDGLIGGPPCPPFSKSRFYRKEKKRGIQDADGNVTITNFFRAIEELKPKFFFFENVHGFVYKPHKEALEFLIKETKRLGYSVVYNVINAADYGIPQTRERFICIGTLKRYPKFNFPSQTHVNTQRINGSNLKPWVTAGDVLADIDFDLPEDINMVAGSKHKDLLKLVPPGDNYLFFTEKRGYPDPIFQWRSRYWSFLLKLSPDRPSWTIQASHSNNMGPFHWKNRFLRIQEIMRIQSFDDDFKIRGSYKDQWRQVGNAVPPKLAYQFAQEIRKQIFN